jgi:hypothetical protein
MWRYLWTAPKKIESTRPLLEELNIKLKLNSIERLQVRLRSNGSTVLSETFIPCYECFQIAILSLLFIEKVGIKNLILGKKSWESIKQWFSTSGCRRPTTENDTHLSSKIFFNTFFGQPERNKVPFSGSSTNCTKKITRQLEFITIQNVFIRLQNEEWWVSLAGPKLIHSRRGMMQYRIKMRTMVLIIRKDSRLAGTGLNLIKLLGTYLSA